MSPEDKIALVRRLLRIFDTGDFRQARDSLERAKTAGEMDWARIGPAGALILELVDPAMEVEFFTDQRPIEGRQFVGLNGFFSLWADWLAAFDDYALTASGYEARGEEVIVDVKHLGRGRGSGLEIVMPQTAIYTVRDGKVVRCRIFPAREDALAALETA